MSVESTGAERPSFDLKSAQLPVLSVVLRSTDMQALTQDLASRLADDPDFFDNDPVLIDLSQVREAGESIDFVALVDALRAHRTVPVAVRGGSPGQMEAAHALGLTAAPDATPIRRAEPEIHEIIREVEVVHEVEIPAPQADALIVERPLRSGQRVYAKGTDIVVLDIVSYGAEVIADGNVHVYAPLIQRTLLAGNLSCATAAVGEPASQSMLVARTEAVKRRLFIGLSPWRVLFAGIRGARPAVNALKYAFLFA